MVYVGSLWEDRVLMDEWVMGIKEAIRNSE